MFEMPSINSSSINNNPNDWGQVSMWTVKQKSIRPLLRTVHDTKNRKENLGSESWQRDESEFSENLWG